LKMRIECRIFLIRCRIADHTLNCNIRINRKTGCMIIYETRRSGNN
jgi:hypothetical protein